MTLPNNIYELASFLAAGFFFVPIILVTFKNLFRNKTILWFAVYWFWSGLINILCSLECMSDTLALSIIERFYNLLDTPVMLFIMYKTTEVTGIRKSLHKILLPFIVLEIIMLVITGFNIGMESALVFCGVLVVLFFLLWTIISYSKQTSYNGSLISYQYIYYALFFEYAISIITVIYSYILPANADNADNFLIYHISTIVAIATASAGILNFQEEKPAAKMKKSKLQTEAEIRYL